MFKLNITTKLVLLFLLIGIIPMMVVGLSNYNKMEKSHDLLTRETIQSVLHFKKNLVEEYFEEVKSDLEVVAGTREVMLLIDELHDHFAAEGDKETLNTDSEIFKTILNRYNNQLTFMGDKFGFSDIYVICKNHGHVMYSANRGRELGQNLKTGKIRQSGLARAWRKSTTEKRTVLEDYSHYGADTGLPQAFAATPVLDENGDNIGTVAIAIPLNYINNLLKDTAGLGESGETYLVGSDFLMRSDSRLDKESSILHREVRTAPVIRAMEGVSECGASLDYGNTSVLACSGKLAIPDFDWAIVAKIGHAEVDAFADELLTNLIFLFAIFGAVTLISAVVFSMLFVDPIRKLAEATGILAKGDLTSRVAVNRKDELGDLANSFNEMADGMRDIVAQAGKIAEGDFNVTIKPRSEHDQLGLTLQKMTQNLNNYAKNVENTAWQQTGRAQLAEITQGEVKLDPLSHKIITYLSKYIGAQVAAIYLLDEDGKLRLSGNYAFTHRKNLSQKFAIGESLVGQAALEKNRIVLENVPEDYAAVQSALGESPPKSIVLQPVLYEGELLGVIEFGSLYPFTKDTLNFLDTAAEVIGNAIHNAIGHNTLNMLLETSQQQAEELEVQQEELRQTNQELEEHTRTLKENEDQLKTQQEMLETTNTELEERTEALQQQKYEILKQNEEVESARQMLVIKAKELEVTSKYKSEFLANMSHELRTPLNSLLILSSLLVENKDQNLSTKQQEFARTINSSGQELLELINEILDLSKVEAGKIELNLESFNVERMLSDIRAKLRPLAEKKGLEFNVDIASSVPEQIRSDSQRLGQILRNLISNALKFTENGQVKLIAAPPSDEVLDYLGFSTKKRDQYLAFAIEDTGIGIPQDKQQLVFEAFQQADGTTQRRYGGTGLGLSISRELAKLLGGGIYLTSEEGKGSVFTVVVEVEKSTDELVKEPDTFHNDVLGFNTKSEIVNTPASPADLTDAGNGDFFVSGEEAETMLVSATGKDNNLLSATPLPKQAKSVENIRDDRREIEKGDRSLLIVEDDEEFTRTLIELSREQGFKVLVAHEGASALHLADYYLPSGILLDIGLPGGMDGLTVLTMIKENLRTRHIPVHVISGHERRAEAMRIGAVGFLQKPVNIAQLQGAFSRIQSVISREVKRLLLVEDNENENKSLRALLDDAQLAIVSAFSGKEALQILKHESFDCIVLDLGLPDMSGIEMLKKMRLDESDVHIPVIIFTGKELSSKERRELDKYAERVLVKGVRSPERLLDETALFLHTVEKELPEQKRNILKMLHDKEAIFDGRKILIVDDDMRNVFALSSILEEKGLDLLVAGDGQESIDILNANPDIHLVLMDIMMPVMDGYEAMERIRTYPEFKNLPIIALTAKAMKGDRAKCIEAGASDYLAKPVDTDKLLSMLRVWLYQ